MVRKIVLRPQAFYSRLPGQIAALFLEQCTKMNCRACGTTLPSEIEHYSHPSGWEVPGMEEKQWLFITCSHCGYQNALWKLGCDR